MSDVAGTTVPAGWYPDPAGSFQQRWWNGSSWTNDFAQYRPSLVHATTLPASHGGQSIHDVLAARSIARPVPPANAPAAQPTYESDSPAAAAYAAQTASTREASGTQTLTRAQPEQETVEPLPAFSLPQDDQAPQTRVAEPNAANAMLVPVKPLSSASAFSQYGDSSGFGANYQPFGREPEVRSAVGRIATRAHTPAVWLMAFIPAIFFAGAVSVALFANDFYTVASVAILAAMLLLVSFGLAMLDVRALSLDYHLNTASAAWVFLTPLSYLVARTMAVARETGRVVPWPLLTALVVYAGILACIYVVPVLAPLMHTISPL